MTRVPDTAIDELHDVGFSRVEDFLTEVELAALAAPLADVVPTREEYHADPERHTHLVETQSGHRLLHHPALPALTGNTKN